MVADIVLLIWLGMAAVYGWKRKMLIELNSLFMFLVSYAAARLVGMTFSASLAPSMKMGDTTFGPLGTEALISFGLFLILSLLLSFLWKKFKPAGRQAGIRIEVDAQGQPIVKGAKLKAFVGALLGMIRAALLYTAVLFWLMLLVPIVSFKDGKGLRVARPKAYTVQFMRQVDPTLQSIEWTTRGMRALRNLQRNRKARRKAYRNKQIKALLRSQPIKAIYKQRGLLAWADKPKHGRRDSTLLLWLPGFQQAVSDKQTAAQLKQLAKAFPAPFDIDRDKSSKVPAIRIKK